MTSLKKAIKITVIYYSLNLINKKMIDKLKWKLFAFISNKMKLEDINNYSKWRRTRNKLKIDTKEYPYLFHSYNNMGLTERSVEIPIIYHYLNTLKISNVLEVGNVTNY